jgi:hypothetical protein
MRRLRAIAFAGVAMAALFSARGASGQASAGEMASFPIPPVGGYHATKTFGFTGDHGYYTAPVSSSAGGSSNASDYRYVRYRGIAGKRVFLYGAWGTSAVPPPSGGGDACGHTHASYGVWVRWTLVMPWVDLYRGWILAGGGGMSGVRDSKGQCDHRTDNPLGDIDSRFGWGDDFETFDLRSSTVIDEIVIGVLSNTHGWGTCRGGGFPACHEPSYIIGYTLP